MRDILRRYQPSRVEDLTALNALYRPGPIQGGMIDDFIERKHGRKQVTYELPILKEILDETYGVMVYQEQVMQISNKVAGYSLGEADILRRIMGKKKQEEMDAQRARFLEGAAQNNIPARKAEKIFDQMAEFAKYGFNKSHSAAYAYLAFITAYLKAHYPTEFMAAILTSETGNTTKVVKYINECRDMGISVLPADINRSQLNFTPEGDSIRFGLGAIKNLGGNAVEAILDARRECGGFTSIFQFCERVDLTSMNKRVIENLIKAGAMDALGGTRSQLTAAVDGAIEAGQRASRDRASGQGGLFTAFAAEEHPEQPLPKVPDWTAKSKLAGEKEVLGFYVSGHPLDEFGEKVKELATHDTPALEGLARGTEIAICGVITNLQRRRNKEGKLWASFQLDDWFGLAECMAFASVYETMTADMSDDRAVLVRGLALPEDNAPSKISVKEVVPLEVAGVQLPRLISIKILLGRSGEATASELTHLFEKKPGEAEVRLRLEKPRDFSIILDVSARVRPDKEFCAEVERICGPQSMEVLAN
jgi:DNA polymerase-3 subunit alpha